MENILRKIGLTEGEYRVFLSLIRLGESTTGPISRQSKVSKSKVYDILDRLIEKGFVNYVIKNNIKYFSTSDPKLILDYIEKKKQDIENTMREAEEMIPKLVINRNTLNKGKIAEIYEGFSGLKIIRTELLNEMSGELLVLGAPKIANEKWEGWFLSFHKQRIKKKIPIRILYNNDAIEYGKTRSRMRLTKVRYLPSNMNSPNWIDIFHDKVLFVVLVNTPIAFVIRDKNFADSFRSYFEVMWKFSKE